MGILVSPTDWNDWRWGGTAVNPTGAPSPAPLNQIGATGTYAYEFTSGDTKSFHDLQLPHDYKEGTDLIPHIHFMPSTTATYTGTWSLTYVEWLGAYTTAPMVGPTTITASFNSSVTQYQMQTVNFSSVLSGTGRQISSIIHATLSLSLTSGTSVFLNGLDAHYQIDRLGSVNPTSKT
jgi:hypothetical protein